MRKPSVSILHFTCSPIVGGVESVIAATARLLADHGYSVNILAGRGRQFDDRIPVAIVPKLDSKNPALLDINQELERGEVSRHFRRFAQALLLTLRHHLAETDLCIVHNAFTLHFNLPLTVALHQLVAERPLAFIAWCHDLSWTNHLYIPKMRDAEPWSLLKKRLEDVRYVVVSQERQRELADLFGVEREAIHVVANGVDPGRFLKLSAPTLRLVKAHDLFSQDLVLLLPARITARKNIELAIRVIAALKERRLRAKLLITGPPGPHNVRSTDYMNLLLDLRQRLGIVDEVVFLYEENNGRNRVSDRLMSDLFDVSDALFFPSTQEGFGIPLLESGLARLPVFCSRIPALEEVGGDDVVFFSPADEPDAIAQQLISFQKDDRSHRLNKRVLRKFTWESIFKRDIEPLINRYEIALAGNLSQEGGERNSSIRSHR